MSTHFNNPALNQDPQHPEINPSQTPPNQPEKHIPAKPDTNPDPTKITPGVNEPEKADPTRIDQPEKTDPTRINNGLNLSEDYFPIF